jgi:alcohol dehydrogenase, propanol-preferring
MRAMILPESVSLSDNPAPLRMTNLPVPQPGPGEVLLRVKACGVCHTELDEIEGRLPPPQLPVVLGHQVVGIIEARGQGVVSPEVGQRVGVAWIYSACGECEWCRSGQENLCPRFCGTGRDAAGGYAEYMVARAAFVHPIPERFTDAEAAPLLCAGAIGYRSLRLAGIQDGDALGLTGFGASAHLVLKMAQHRYPHSPVFVFSRTESEQAFARELGAAWAGNTEDRCPVPLRAVIDTTPAWGPIVHALRNLQPGGRLVINAIRKERRDRDALLELDYATDLWSEKEVKSIANVTRQDVREFLALAAAMSITPAAETYALEEANRALLELKTRKIRGAKVLLI